MTTSTQRQIAANVHALMGLSGWTQTDLHAATGIAQSAISKKLRGLGDWTLRDLERMANALHVTVSELTGTIPTAQDWDRRRQPTALSGPRFFVMPEASVDGTPPLSFFGVARLDIMSDSGGGSALPVPRQPTVAPAAIACAS